MWQRAHLLSAKPLGGHIAVTRRQFSLPPHALSPPAHAALYKLKPAPLDCLETPGLLACFADMPKAK